MRQIKEHNLPSDLPTDSLDNPENTSTEKVEALFDDTKEQQNHTNLTNDTAKLRTAEQTAADNQKPTPPPATKAQKSVDARLKQRAETNRD